MKASEMTNEMLAHNLEATIPFLMKEARHLTDADEIMIEAAARLRNVTVRSDSSAVIVELQRRLKVAEDALESVIDDCDVGYDLITTIRNALAAIREEGGAKASGESEVE